MITLPAEPRGMIEALNQAGFEAYVVGGCVRDSLMGKIPHDWDICTSALPEEVLRVFSDKQVIKTGLQHGTVTVVERGEGYEITTYRVEGTYSDHRHPDKVRFVSRLREDLSRRDFTINAMAYHPQQGVIDYFGGKEDLEQGLIRCVGVPAQRFQEDGLRILRALRFAARFGFRIEESTGQAVHDNRGLLEHIAAERIFSELKGFLVGTGVKALLQDYRDVWSQILPQLERMFDFQQRNIHHCYDVWTHTVHAVEAAPQDVMIRLTLLFHDCGKPDCWSRDESGVDHFYQHPRRSEELAQEMLRQLRCDNKLRDQVLLQVRYHDMPLPQSERSGRRFLRIFGGADAAFASLEVHRADYMAQSPEFLEEKLACLDQAAGILNKLLADQACFVLKNLALRGRDLLDLGFPKGPELGRELNRLLELVIDGKCPNEKEALLKQVSFPKNMQV